MKSFNKYLYLTEQIICLKCNFLAQFTLTKHDYSGYSDSFYYELRLRFGRTFYNLDHHYAELAYPNYHTSFGKPHSYINLLSQLKESFTVL